VADHLVIMGGSIYTLPETNMALKKFTLDDFAPT